MSRGPDLQRVLNTLGHDLRGPLFTAQGFLQLVLTRTEGKAQEHARYALESVEQAARMVNGVLQWARTDPAAMEVSAIDLDEAVRGALSDLDALARRRDVRVKIEDLPDITGDPRAVRYAVQHLLDNAVRHGKAGGTVTVRAGSGADGWWIEVVDEGPGIDGELERFKQPFWEAADRDVGAGIALAHRVAMHHRGRLDLESGPTGTRARITGGG